MIYAIPTIIHIIAGSILLLAASLDLRMFIYGGAHGVHRIIRHLWRSASLLYLQQ